MYIMPERERERLRAHPLVPCSAQARGCLETVTPLVTSFLEMARQVETWQEAAAAGCSPKRRQRIATNGRARES